MLAPTARTPMVTLESGGARLPAVLHLPAGPGPHPIVLLMHGFPGAERNFDLAQSLRRWGYATVVFHYRGSWGAEGDWSWGNALEDARNVSDAVMGRDFAGVYDLDPRRLALVGHSMGGFVALMTAAANPSIRAVVSVAGFDFGPVAAACRADAATKAEYVEGFDAELLPLRGTSGAALVSEMMEAGEKWSLRRLAPHLADRPTLLIGTGRDPVTPAEVHHHPLVDTFATYPVPRLEHQFFDTDHQLSDHRDVLADTVRGFLGRQMPGHQ